MLFSRGMRVGALMISLLCSTPSTHAETPPPIASSAEWGVYAQLAGHTFINDKWRVSVYWKIPGQELVEHWESAAAADKVRTITRTGPGQLHQAATAGCLNRDGRIQPDGSVLFLCNSPLVKDPYVIAAPSADVMEQREAKLKDGAIAAITDTLYLKRSSTAEEKQQFAAAGGASAADWGVYTSLAGTRWSGEERGYQWTVSIDWDVVGQSMTERWEMANGGLIIAKTTAEPGTGKLRQVSNRQACNERTGSIQPDGSVLFICKSLIKHPTQVAAAPGLLELREVALQNGQITGIKRTWPFNELPGETAQAGTQPATPEEDYQRGLRFDNGDGVTESDTIAAAWYRRAAERGHTLAQHNLATMYRHGKGVTQDYAQALDWFRKAAEQGQAASQNDLGTMYTTGHGVAIDPAQAAQWFRRAAEQGLAAAQSNLASLYESGSGVAQSDAEAIAWYDEAAAQGFAGAGDKAKQLRDRIAAAEQLAIQKVAADRARNAALASGDAEAQYQLGRQLQKGEGFPKDEAGAAELYRRAAEHGHAAAQNMLGLMLASGWGIPIDIPQAIDWYRKAAFAGNTDAQTNLGWMYRNGQGVPQDDAQAEVWYRKAAAAGNSTAQSYLNSLLAQREAEFNDEPAGPSGAQIFANALNTFSQEYNNAMAQQQQAQAQIQQAYARAEAARQREEEWELRRREAEQRIAREEAEAAQARQEHYAMAQAASAAAQQQTHADQQRAAETQARAEAAQRAAEQRAIDAEIAKREAERQRQAKEAAWQAEQQRQVELKRQEEKRRQLEEEARNRPVAYREGVVLCEAPQQPSKAWRCHGPLQTSSGILDTPSGNVAIGNACGGDNYRDLGMVSGYRAFGCGYGIHPTDRTYPGNRDIPAKFGVNYIPGSTVYHCNPNKVLAYCKGQG